MFAPLGLFSVWRDRVPAFMVQSSAYDPAVANAPCAAPDDASTLEAVPKKCVPWWRVHPDLQAERQLDAYF